MSNEGLNLPEIDINLEDESIRAWGGESGPKLPIGTYTMDIATAEQDVSKTNNPVVKVTFAVADEGEHYGVELTKSYSLQKQSLGRIKSLMIAAGCRLDKIRPAELVGSRILVDIVHTQGVGKPDTNGEVKPGGLYCDVTNERAMQEPEPAPPPPPAAKGKAAAATVAAPAAATTKNGSVARRA